MSPKDGRLWLSLDGWIVDTDDPKAFWMLAGPWEVSTAEELRQLARERRDKRLAADPTLLVRTAEELARKAAPPPVAPPPAPVEPPRYCADRHTFPEWGKDCIHCGEPYPYSAAERRALSDVRMSRLASWNLPLQMLHLDAIAPKRSRPPPGGFEPHDVVTYNPRTARDRDEDADNYLYWWGWGGRGTRRLTSRS